MARKNSKKQGNDKKKPRRTKREFDAVAFFTALQSFLSSEATLLEAGDDSGLSYPTFKKYANEFLLEVYDQDSLEEWLKRHNGKYDGSLGTFDEWVIRTINGDRPFREYFDFEQREKKNKWAE